MRKKTKTYCFGNDAGNICATDLAYYESFGGKVNTISEDACEIIQVPPGIYNVTLHIQDTYIGSPITATKELDIKSGKLAIGDACYFFQDDESDSWGKFLDTTKFLTKSDDLLCLNTGGDGVWDVKVTIAAKKI